MGQGFAFESFFKRRISRRGFIKLCLGGIGGFFMSGLFYKLASAQETSSGRIARPHTVDHDLSVVTGEDPYQITVKAVEALGGMNRFVNKNSTVLIKPNIAWDRTPEQANNTNPMVVASLVELCFKAGAKRVNVFDIPCNDARRTYESSGIAKAAMEKGANVYFADEWNFMKAHFSYSSPMEGWPIYRDAIECDTFINVPILKNHGLTGLTLSMKNLMGVCGGDRGVIHSNIGLKLVHLTDFIKPDLTIIDAYRVLLANGPSSGNPEDIKLYKTIIAGVDPTLVDSYASELVGEDPMSVTYIREAKKHKFGNSDTSKADILKL